VLAGYYGPFVKAIETGRPVKSQILGVDFTLAKAKVLGMPLAIGLPTSVIQDPFAALALAKELRKKLLESPAFNDDKRHLCIDGLFLQRLPEGQASD